ARFRHRLAVPAASAGELREALEAFARGEAPGRGAHGVAEGEEPPRVAFLFTGQGAQYPGMGRELYDTLPVFREALDRCAALFDARLERPLLPVLFPGPGAESPIHRTDFTQAALFALEYALAETWRAWGVTPAAVLGHSVGEYAAACVAGALSLEDAVALVAARGSLMAALPRDGMMAMATAGLEQVEAALAPFRGRVDVAAVNAPSHTVISGCSEGVRAVMDALEAEWVMTRPLEVSHAFHSSRMEPMLDAFEEAARGVACSVPRIPLVSNLTGKALEPGRAPDAAYWRSHVRSPVLFAPGVEALVGAGCTVFLEIGPAAVLARLGRKILPDGGHDWVPSLERDQPAWRTLAGAAATLWTRGVEVDWAELGRGVPARRRTMPTYPFQRTRCWLEPHEIRTLTRTAAD
ncbi:MAG TPA: acyltransferase domain-containing protein, partial [Longimicrobiaceae bacterium]|nr:acyltransferase domain-containing protein [Longimicrobiaceae bacterium]